MGVINAAIEHRNDGIRASGVQSPCLGGVNVGTDQAATLAGVLEIPLSGETGVIGESRSTHQVIGLGV